MKKLTLFFIEMNFLFINTNISQINNNTFMELLNGDTIHCKALEYKTNKNGRLNYIKYTTTEGKEIENKGKKHVPKLASFRHQRQTFEMVPRRLYNPKKRNIVAKRLVEGKISYCYFNNEEWGTTTRVVSSGSGSSLQSNTAKTGFKLRYVKISGGNYFQLSKRSMKKKLKPHLKKCDAFNKSYTGNFKVNFLGTGIVDMLKLYNDVCKE
jgi:hypothetical protein